MLWKAAGHHTAGAGCVPIPRIARGPAAHPALLDVVNCQCNAAGKACSSHACSWFCFGEAMCFNLVTKHDDNQARFDNEDEGDSTEE